MSTKKVAGAAATAPATKGGSGWQPSIPIPILPDDPTDVKVLQALKDMKIDNGEIVDMLRTTYEGFDKSLLSKVRKPAKYGVRFVEPALRLLRVRYGVTPQDAAGCRRKPARQKPCRCQCRVTQAVYGALQHRISQTGLTMQDYLESLILKDLNEGGTQ